MKKPERGWKVDTLINVARKETESMKKREYKTDGEEARARLQDLLESQKVAYPLVDLRQGQCLLVFERNSDEVGAGGIRHGTGYWVLH